MPHYPKKPYLADERFDFHELKALVEASTADGSPYIAMRYVPGQPLGLVTPQLHAASDASK